MVLSFARGFARVIAVRILHLCRSVIGKSNIQERLKFNIDPGSKYEQNRNQEQEREIVSKKKFWGSTCVFGKSRGVLNLRITLTTGNSERQFLNGENSRCERPNCNRVGGYALG
ncbi:hypothetical protein EVAR_65557_1 [Eumeta japonica]|uniref:Uncharacterized protein n=1 Tax=Eumeta variegata TaxID=151549 RepID=A0A4C1ZBA7_EUMVA|nr:hypothetical protein EVAR_65557_1 [Eumeta japonica]